MCMCVCVALYLSSFPSFQEQQDKGDQNDGKKMGFWSAPALEIAVN